MRYIYLLLFILAGCISPKENDTYDQAYRDVVGRMAEELNRLGSWEFSPDGKDSLWNKTDATNNLNLMDSVLANLEPIEREWDSLTFLARKYDTIPLPSNLLMGRWETIMERKVFILRYRPTLKKLVDGGVYSRDGQQLRDLIKEIQEIE